MRAVVGTASVVIAVHIVGIVNVVSIVTRMCIVGTAQSGLETKRAQLQSER